jgi:hypothetical protein
VRGSRGAFAVLRAALAAVYALAVAAQLTHSIGFWQGQPRADIPFLVLGFFSYFTMESGIAAVVVLGAGAVLLLTKADPPGWLPVARGLIVVYTATTGIAYNLLLRPIETDDGSVVPWSNEWLHLYGPMLLVLDWLLAPDRRPLPWRSLWLAVGIPLAWAAYTFARGPFALDTRTDTNWYPYPFLNPDTAPGGYATTTLYVVAISGLIIALSALVILSSRRRRPPGADVDAMEPASSSGRSQLDTRGR